jgi:hypothetical protein
MERMNGVTLSKDGLRFKQIESNFPCEQGKVNIVFKQVAKLSNVDFDFAKLCCQGRKIYLKIRTADHI